MRQYWASCDPYSDMCDGGGLSDNKVKHYWERMNDSERVDLEWEELSFIDWVRINFDKENAILVIVLDKLDEAWFNAYNERKCRLLGLTYREPHPILIEDVKVTRYTIGPKEIYMKVKVLGIDKMPRTRDNIATIRVRLMKEIGSHSKEIEFELIDHPKNETLRLVREFSDVDPLFVRKSTSIGARDARFGRGNQVMKDLKASYGIATPQELCRNQN
ncbi:hypothetical protein Tco_0394925 [Tanacetum coccineum]